MTKEQHPNDTIYVSDTIRITLILPERQLPQTWVSFTTRIDEIDEDGEAVGGSYSTQGQFQVERFKNGDWHVLAIDDYTQAFYAELKPLLDKNHLESCQAWGDRMGQRRTPETVHVPITGHRKQYAWLRQNR